MSFICPFCLQRHEKKDLQYRCLSTQSCRFGVRGEQGTIAFRDLDKCQKKCDQRFVGICPDETYGGKVIPSQAMEPGVSVALLGGRNSGKSNYIAVLVDQIKRHMSVRFNCSLMPCDDTTAQRYEEYFAKPIYKEHRPLDSTSSGRQDPLLFSVNFNKKGMFGNKLDTMLLPLYDTAGENMENEANLVQNANYIRVAGGIMLLLDPFEIEEIAEQLAENGVPSAGVAIEKMENILNRLQILLQRNQTHKIIDTPIAIVLTKLDLLTDYTNLVPSDSVLRFPSAHLSEGAYSKREHEAVDSAVRELLSGCSNANNLFQKLKAFKNASFFAVSSFGCDPLIGDLKTSMKPQRVLDPLLWLLSLHGYIKVAR